VACQCAVVTKPFEVSRSSVEIVQFVMFKPQEVLVERKAVEMVGSMRMWQCWRSTPHPALLMPLGRLVSKRNASKLMR